ncbi:MAG: DUF4347 domain-containing protein [Planctomycetota bacterium]
MKSSRQPNGYALQAVALERRLLFSASPIPGVNPEVLLSGAIDLGIDQEQQAFVDSSPFQLRQGGSSHESLGSMGDPENASRIELVFVDAAVDDYESLVDEIRAENAGSEIEIFLLEPDRDGVDQISELLEGYDAISAIHLLSHGNDGRIHLGDATLRESTLNSYAGQLASWTDHLSENADILIYGCEVAETDSGQYLIDSISALTGADVAASVDDTGAQSLEGNWELEYSTGTIETSSVLHQSAWQGLLATAEIFEVDEQRVNDSTSGSQSTEQPHQSVAVDDNGNTVVVWTDDAEDGDGDGIFARRYDRDGNALGAAFQVNVDATGDQSLAVVDMDASGRFVVAWIGQDADNTGVFARRFAADGSAIDSSDILVNSLQELGEQTNVSVSVNDNNQIVFAWESNGFSEGIYSRTFDFTSTPAGGQLATALITVDNNSTASDVSVDINQTGRYSIVWDDSSSMWGRQYNFGSNSAVDTRRDINLGGGNEGSLAVATLSNNDYVIAYRSDVLFFRGVWIRLIPESGSAPIATAVSLTNAAVDPSISVNENDVVVVTYTRDDTDGAGVYARAYDDSQDAIGGEIAVNQSTGGNQRYSSVAVHDDDNFVVVWSGQGSQTGEVDSDGVFMRYFGTANTAPVAAAASETITEGDSITFDASASTDADGDPLIYRWDLDNDGDFSEAGEPTGVAPTVDWSTLQSFGIDDDGTYTVGLQVDDQNGGIDTTTITVTVTPLLNTTPVTINENQTIFYTEGDTNVAIGDIVVSDPDASEIVTARLTLDLPSTGDLSTGTFGSTTSTYNSFTGIWLAVGTVADVNAALADVEFLPETDNDRDSSVSVVIQDAGGSSAPGGLISFVVTPVNDAPAIDLDADDSSGATGGDFQTVFNEGGPSVSIADADASVSDIDNATIDSIEVTITNLIDGGSELLTADTTGTSITAVYSAGTLNLSGADSLANYQQVVRSIQYQNTSFDPDTTERNITFAIDDGTSVSTATSTVSIAAVNDAPAIDLDADDSSGATGSGFLGQFTEGGGSVLAVDADATLADVDSSTLDSIEVTITNLLDGGFEFLSADTTGTSISAIYSSGVLTLSGADSVSNYQQVLRSIEYQNTSLNPTTTSRVITFAADDGASVSNATATLTVVATNDPPTLDLDADDSSGASGSGYQTVFTEGGPAVTIVDVDALLVDSDGTTMTSIDVRITNLFDGADEILSADTTGTAISASFSSGTLTLSGIDSIANYQQVLRTIAYQNVSVSPETTTRVIEFVADDGTSASNVANSSVQIVTVDSSPSVTGPTNQGTQEDVPMAISGLSVADADSGVLRVRFNVDNGSLSIDTTISGGITNADVFSNGTRTVIVRASVDQINATLGAANGLVYSPNQDFNGNDSLTIRVTDGTSQDFHTTSLTVAAVNDSPVAANDIYSVAADTTLIVRGGGLLENDIDVDGDTISVSLVQGPSTGTLTVLPNGNFRFVPEESFTGLVVFRYQVTDGVDPSNVATVRIFVNPLVTDVELRDDVPDEIPDENTDDNEDESETSSDDGIRPLIVEVNRDDNSPTRTTSPSQGIYSADPMSLGLTRQSFDMAASLSSTSTQGSFSYDSSSIASSLSVQPQQIITPNAKLIGIADFSSSLLWGDLQEVNEQFSRTLSSPLVAAGTFAGFSGALSVGYVLWTIRGGLLATSLLVHLPAWSFVDPLLVLSDLEDEGEDSDDDSLEGMLEREKNPDETTSSREAADGHRDLSVEDKEGE